MDRQCCEHPFVTLLSNHESEAWKFKSLGVKEPPSSFECVSNCLDKNQAGMFEINLCKKEHGNDTLITWL